MMCPGVHFLHNLLHLAIYTHKKGDTVDPHRLPTHRLFEAPRALLLRDGVVFIRQQITVPLFFLLELF